MQLTAQNVLMVAGVTIVTLALLNRVWPHAANSLTFPVAALPNPNTGQTGAGKVPVFDQEIIAT